MLLPGYTLTSPVSPLENIFPEQFGFSHQVQGWLLLYDLLLVLQHLLPLCQGLYGSSLLLLLYLLQLLLCILSWIVVKHILHEWKNMSYAGVNKLAYHNGDRHSLANSQVKRNKELSHIYLKIVNEGLQRLDFAVWPARYPIFPAFSLQYAYSNFESLWRFSDWKMEVLRYLSQSNVIYMLPVGSGLLLNWWRKFCMHHIDTIKHSSMKRGYMRW